MKSFARIHKANLINFGILPLTFKNITDYDLCSQDATVLFPDIHRLIENGATEIPALINGVEVITILDVSRQQREELLAGGTLNYVKLLTGQFTENE